MYEIFTHCLHVQDLAGLPHRVRCRWSLPWNHTKETPVSKYISHVTSLASGFNGPSLSSPGIFVPYANWPGSSPLQRYDPQPPRIRLTARELLDSQPRPTRLRYYWYSRTQLTLAMGKALMVESDWVGTLILSRRRYEDGYMV